MARNCKDYLATTLLVFIVFVLSSFTIDSISSKDASSSTNVLFNRFPTVKYRYEIFVDYLEREGLESPMTKDAFHNLRMYYRNCVDSTIVYNVFPVSSEARWGLCEEWGSFIKSLEKKYGQESMDVYKRFCISENEKVLGEGYYKKNLVGEKIDLVSESILDKILLSIILYTGNEASFFKELLSGIHGFNGESKPSLMYDVLRRVDFEYQRQNQLYSSISFLFQMGSYFKDTQEDELAEKVVTDLSFRAFDSGDYSLLNTLLNPIILLKDYPYYQETFYDAGQMIDQLLCLTKYLRAIGYERDEIESYLNLADSLICHNAVCKNHQPIPSETKAGVYQQLTGIQCDKGDFVSAESSIRKAIMYIPTWQYGLQLSLAQVLTAQGRFSESDAILAAISDYGKRDYTPLELKSDLSSCLTQNALGDKDYAQALASASNHFLMLRRAFNSQASTLDRRGRAAIWERDYNGLLPWFSYVCYTCGEDASLAYNAALFQKGILLNYDRIIYTNILSSDDNELKEAYRQYKEVEQNGFDSQGYEYRLMWLYSRHQEFGSSFPELQWQDVQSRLKDNDLAIEFTRFVDAGGTSLYAALVLSKDSKYPVLVKLCSEEELNRLYTKGSDLYGKSNDQAYSLIWEPLEPYLSRVDDIFFSPFELLSQLNIEVLRDKKNKMIGRNHNLHRVSSTAGIREEKQQDISSYALFGGLSYALDTTEMKKTVSLYYRNDNSTKPRVSYAIGEIVTIPLPYTLVEVNEVDGLLKRNVSQRKVISGEEGIEESFKALSGNSPSILHIATHGFYINYREANHYQLGPTSREKSLVLGPMERCGLVMSGGKHICFGEDLPNIVDDGILTGAEISGLNLSNTDLLVLSACQTGLGELAGDGVYGLQRGFKAAGVNTIVMSLWGVDDEATSFMMKTFYKHLTKGKNKRDSFSLTQAEVQKKYPNPAQWAAFIMLD